MTRLKPRRRVWRGTADSVRGEREGLTLYRTDHKAFPKWTATAWHKLSVTIRELPAKGRKGKR